MAKIFKTEKEAELYFKDALSDDERMASVEECECCGRFTVSQADDEEGGIVGAYCPESENGGALYDRICEDCSQKSEEEIRARLAEQNQK